jgi:hypothetical protein
LATWDPVFFHWSAGAWTEHPAPAVDAGSPVAFSAISCPAPDRCVAVGATAPSGNGPGYPALATWDGNVWSGQRGPSTEAGGRFEHVSCGGTRCLALGIDNDGPRPVAAVTDDLAAKVWLVADPPPLRDPHLASLEAASCAARVCTVVGIEGLNPGAAPWAARYEFAEPSKGRP